MSPRLLRITIPIAAATLLTALVPAAASAAPADAWGYAVVRKPRTANYNLPGKDRWSVPAGAVSSQRLSRGRHVVNFAGLVMDGGDVQVTPLSGVGDLCTVEGWESGVGGLDVWIDCFGRGGARKDVRFIVNAIEAFNKDVGPQTAYLWADEPTNPSYVPSNLYNFNTAGSDGGVVRASLGRYFVRFPDVDDPAGNVQVSAYGDTRKICRIASWIQDVHDHIGQVICRRRTGALTDAYFSYLFTNDEGMRGAWGAAWAYLVANKPGRASYVPKLLYRNQSPAGTPRIWRLRKGRYVVKLPNMPLGGAAQVTPMGEGNRRCNVSYIRKKGLPQRIGVRCFKADGITPADARFSLSYVR